MVNARNKMFLNAFITILLLEWLTAALLVTQRYKHVLGETIERKDEKRINPFPLAGCTNPGENR